MLLIFQNDFSTRQAPVILYFVNFARLPCFPSNLFCVILLIQHVLVYGMF